MHVLDRNIQEKSLFYLINLNFIPTELNEAYKKAEQDKKDIEQLTRNRDIFKKV